MEEFERRGRGKAYPAAPVQSEIMLFLLTRHEGAASEPDIRRDVSAEVNVSDRGTIRNHLEFLKGKNLIGLKKQKKGLGSIWFVTDDPVVPVYVFSVFEGGQLVKIYRSPFFQRHAKRWYLHRYTGASLECDNELEDVDRVLREDVSDSQGDLFPAVMALSLDALKISPTHFHDKYSTDTHDVGHSFHVLLMEMGKGAMRGEGLCRNPAEGMFARITADLLIDFNLYASTQDDVLEFIREPEFRDLFHELFHDVARGLLSRYLSDLYYRGRTAIDDELRDLFCVEDPERTGGTPL